MYISSSPSYNQYYTYTSPFINSTPQTSNGTGNSSTTTSSGSGNVTSNSGISSTIYSPTSNNSLGVQHPSSDGIQLQADSQIVSGMMSGSSLFPSIDQTTIDTSFIDAYSQLENGLTTDQFAYINNNLASLNSTQDTNLLFSTNLMQQAYSQTNQLLQNNNYNVGQQINLAI